ncbi:MAG: hypothetical protein R3B47_03125 [Bacteroidia bacterium]
MQRLLLVFILLTFSSTLWAQLPPLQPEQDCINAIAVCEDVTTVPVSYQGPGNNSNEIAEANSCLDNPAPGQVQGEVNTVWYTFTAQNSGNVCFLITPRSPLDNYDWAVYDITQLGCGGIFQTRTWRSPVLLIRVPAVLVQRSCLRGAPVSCIPPFLCTNQAEPCIPVVQGNTYVIAINNMSAPTVLPLDFTCSSCGCGR